MRNLLFLILTPVAVAVVTKMDVHFTSEDEDGNEDRVFRAANFPTKNFVVSNFLLLFPVMY